MFTREPSFLLLYLYCLLTACVCWCTIRFHEKSVDATQSLGAAAEGEGEEEDSAEVDESRASQPSRKSREGSAQYSAHDAALLTQMSTSMVACVGQVRPARYNFHSEFSATRQRLPVAGQDARAPILQKCRE